jgi:hypothetical protein
MKTLDDLRKQEKKETSVGKDGRCMNHDGRKHPFNLEPEVTVHYIRWIAILQHWIPAFAGMT